MSNHAKIDEPLLLPAPGAAASAQHDETSQAGVTAPPWNVRFWRSVFHLPFVDRTLRRRTDDMYTKANMDAHLKEDGSYVDVGSGSGHMLERILSSGRRRTCVGVDPYWRPILQVRRRLAENAADRYRFLRVSGQELPFRDASIDGIFFCFVLHHVRYELQDQLIQEARRVLKKDGVVVVFEDTPDGPHEWRRVERWDRIQNFEPPWEKHFYRSVKDWRSYFSKMDLQIVHEHPFDKMIPQMGMPTVPHCVTVLRHLGQPQ